MAQYSNRTSPRYDSKRLEELGNLPNARGHMRPRDVYRIANQWVVRCLVWSRYTPYGQSLTLPMSCTGFVLAQWVILSALTLVEVMS